MNLRPYTSRCVALRPRGTNLSVYKGAAPPPELLKISNVNKTYPGTKALDDVSMSVNAGEVMALLGENGAGKSTLMKILSGAVSRDSGDILVDNNPLPVKNTPLSARDHGIAIIYQELSLLSQLNVAENIYLTREPTFAGKFIDFKTMHLKAQEQLNKLNATHISTRSKVEDLPLPEQQMVEIAKALAVDCKVIIMDEPTTSLTWKETNRLFEVIRNLKEQGVTVIYISHRLDEVFQIADTAAVLRDGRFVGKVAISDVDMDGLVEMMTGKLLQHKKRDGSCDVVYEPDRVVMSVNNVSDGKFIEDVSFDLYENEILGFAGLVGAKRTELARMIFGADRMKEGEITINGKKTVHKSPSHAIQNRLGYLSENRKEEGLNLGMSLRENTVIIDMKPVSRHSLLQNKKVDKVFAYYKESIPIKGDAHAMVVSLSGGNQQKVAFSKWLHSGCEILIFDEPTRGIDVGAKAEIYDLIRKFAKENKGAIVISSDVVELTQICDRVLVMSRGKIISEIAPKDVSQENILKIVVGEGGRHDSEGN